MVLKCAIALQHIRPYRAHARDDQMVVASQVWSQAVQGWHPRSIDSVGVTHFQRMRRNWERALCG